ncbi:metallo-beta-lactamase domain-containing protein 1 [Sceloporus undulatus]|uniref:metallo-beta-lactamase domain-containing protein 1 n=1 Tax=Sceloporus undulatus TaxID=8520 RepID=UPI001C4B3B86|nr:metallo-beta-lactamase domain-containing protein 1 [Sceloporus undulatus]
MCRASLPCYACARPSRERERERERERAVLERRRCAGLPVPAAGEQGGHFCACAEVRPGEAGLPLSPPERAGRRGARGPGGAPQKEGPRCAPVRWFQPRVQPASAADVMALGPPPSEAAPLLASLRPSPPPPLIPGSPYAVLVLQEGYSEELPDGSTRADGTVTLVLGPHLTLVDTGGPWGRERLLAGLAERGVSPGDIRHLVCTHGHSDHAGNLNLFPQAELIVGTDVCLPDGCYLPTGLRQGDPYPLHAGLLEVLPTPGHTQADVSLLVRGTALGDILVAGDLFECQGDEGLWQALSEDPARQAQSRTQALAIANIIVPGHGPPFWVSRKEPGRGGMAGDPSR